MRSFRSFRKLLPWQHLGRKNLGFLYACSQGAEMAWDFNDDSGLKPGVKEPQIPEAEIYNVITSPSRWDLTVRRSTHTI
jgi:hypothetical protein